MATKIRPHWEEFGLALFWTIAGVVMLYYGAIGYGSNLNSLSNLEFSLPRFIISFGILCLAVFGLNYAVRIFVLIPANLPAWLNNAGPLIFGSVLLLGFCFSVFTFGVLLYSLFYNAHNRFTLAWGVGTIACLVILAIYQLLWSIKIFEPFLPWPEEFYNQSSTYKASLPMRLLMNLSSMQHALIDHKLKFGYTLQKVSGPLLTEPDLKTSVALEKPGQRPGLEKSMIAHGGWHANTLGFLSNGSVIFAISDGGTVHFQSGGRKGKLFPPEIKFWDVVTDKVQTASLGQSYVFLTRKYQLPALIRNFRFIVPSGGGKFAIVTPDLIRICEWQSSESQVQVPEPSLVLHGLNGFTPVAFNPEGSKFVWCTAEGQTVYWNLEDNRVQSLRLYPSTKLAQTGQPDGVWGLVFSPDGTKVATVGAEGVLLQNVYTGWRWFAQSNPANEHLTALAFNYNGFEMAIGMTVQSDQIRLAPVNPNRFAEITIAPARPNSLVLQDKEVKWLNVVRLWDLRIPDYFDILAGESPVLEVVFSPDNQILAAVDEIGVLRLWDIASEGLGGKPPRLVALLDIGITGRKTVLSFSPDVQRLVCATDNRLLIFNLNRLRREAKV